MLKHSFFAICGIFLFFSNVYAADPLSIEVAKELNLAYKNTNDCPNGAPSYYCSGILLSIEPLQLDEPWYLNDTRYLKDGNKNLGSFSYLRTDITAHQGQPVYPGGLAGYILAPLNEADEKKLFHYQVMAYYPWDGWTTSGSCDANCNACSDINITSVDQFIQKYVSSDPAFDPGSTGQEECYQSGNPDGFKIGMAVNQYLYLDHPQIACPHSDNCASYNELLVTGWTKDAVAAEQVPIKAIFVLINTDNYYDHSINEAQSLQNAFQMADDYRKVVNDRRQLPVVTLDIEKLNSGASDVFAAAERPVN